MNRYQSLTQFSETTEGGIIYEYKPSTLKPFWRNYEPLTLQRRLRFLMELVKGYRVYYLEKEGEIVAYSVISKGGGRYGFATKDDIVVGPYFVLENYRGKHYSEELVRALLQSEKISYKVAFDWIRYDNEPSIRCAERCGFVKTDTMEMKKPFRQLKICIDHVGDIYLFRYRRQNVNK